MWGNLQDTTLQNALKGPGQLLDGQKVLDYIRGSSANEGQNSGQFRPRYRGAPGVAPLGDSPHNTPLLVQYGGGGTVFLGANDGMLHAFDANTGKEQFAYIPSALISKLAELTNGHAFYVDGEILMTTPAQTPGQYLLVGALGRGGKGLYGLDASNPAGFYENNVKWEINGSRTCPDPDPDTNYLGNVVGSLVYAEVKGKPSVVFGNGYNSCSDKAALAIVNAIDGSVAFIKASDESKNGLAAPGIGEDPTDHAVSAYAGDLLGKMWKFGMIPLLGTPQKILDPGVAPQPITAQPATMVIEPTPGTKRTFVFFGTGSYLGVADRGTTAPQYLYGLADNSGATVSRSDLKPLTFTTAENNGLRVKTATPQSGAATDSKKGWYIQMTDAGERVVSAPIFYRDSVIFTSIVPSNKNDPCDDSKGSGYLYMINPKTGETVERLFILDGAEVPDVASNSNIGEVLGGMPGQARIIEGRIVICGQDVAKCISLGEPHSPPDNPSKGRISWREIITH
jgi:type IV pilus assembly protein PilY1